MLILIILSVLLNDNQVTLKPKQKMVKAKTSQPGQPPQGREGELIKELVQGTLLATGFKASEGDEDVLTQIRNAINNGWVEGDHGDVSISAHQKEVYERNLQRALDTHLNELQTVYSGTQTYAISPEPDPTRTYSVVGDEVGGWVVEWQQLGCMQLRSGEGGQFSDLEEGFWELSALMGPPLPPEYWNWNSCEKAEWQVQFNKQLIAYRLLVPEETYPQLMALRPPSFFEYFSELHNPCDACYEDEPYFCDPCPRNDPEERCFAAELPPSYEVLPMVLESDSSKNCVWEIDYQVGQVAPYKENWPKEFIDDGSGGLLPIPKLQVGEDKIVFDGYLEDIVKIEAVKIEASR